MTVELRQSKTTKMVAAQEWYVVSTRDILMFFWQKLQKSTFMTVPFFSSISWIRSPSFTYFRYYENVKLFVSLTEPSAVQLHAETVWKTTIDSTHGFEFCLCLCYVSVMARLYIYIQDGFINKYPFNLPWVIEWADVHEMFTAWGTIV